jgi:hypothetical protein
VVCVRAESQFLNSLGADAAFIRGVRYVDDLCGCICFSKTDEQTKLRVERTLLELKTKCYPEGLVLEEEKIENGSFSFLETQTCIKGNSISVKHRSKNIESLCRQKFFTLQSADAFTSKNTKRGVIVSRLMTIVKNSESNANLFQSVGECFLELKILGYGQKS